MKLVNMTKPFDADEIEFDSQYLIKVNGRFLTGYPVKYGLDEIFFGGYDDEAAAMNDCEAIARIEDE